MKDDDPDKRRWFRDYLRPDVTMLYRVREDVFKGQTKYQSVEIIDTAAFGVCLVLDGKVQSSSSDEFIYHEALVHPVMLAHHRPEKVMVAGGGEGATLREVLAHGTVSKAIMVDIDEEEVGICRRLLPSFHRNSFDDPRAKVCFSDARQYLEESNDKFDVIIIDLVDPLEMGPARLLYTQEFYRLVSQRLAPGGILSVQSEPAGWLDLENFVAIVNTLKSVFSFVSPYRVHVPAFNTMWGFASASQSIDPAKLTSEEIDARTTARSLRELRYYDGSAHQAMFSIPKHIRGQLSRATDVITDSHPISAF
jgi:spermidine synthase